MRTWLGILHVSAKDPRGLIGVELKAGDSRSLAYQLCFGLVLFFPHSELPFNQHPTARLLRHLHTKHRYSAFSPPKPAYPEGFFSRLSFTK